MKPVRLLLSGLFLLMFLVEFASGVRGSLNIDGEVERELTFEIGAGREECFFESVKKGNIIDIEYQVIPV
jgi:emp24/gp25L/p24 family/GOLD